jgi:hypothetical protein
MRQKDERGATTPGGARGFLKSSGATLLVALVVVCIGALGLWSLGAVHASGAQDGTPSWAATYTNQFMMSDAAAVTSQPAARPEKATGNQEEAVKLLRSWTYTDFPPTRGG